MSRFEFNITFISIIAGLALARLLTGASRTVGKPIRDIDFAHLTISFSIIVLLLTVWWSMFRWSHHETWSFTDFLVISIYTSMFYVLASILYPVHATDVPRFADIRMRFYSVFIIYMMLEMLHGYVRDGNFSPWWYVPMVAILTVLSGAGMVLRRHGYDVFYGVFSVALNIAWPFLARLKG